MNRVSTNGMNTPSFRVVLEWPCQVMHPAMVETRFIASSGDGALGMTGQLKEVNN
jgi:hypothetical protein